MPQISPINWILIIVSLTMISHMIPTLMTALFLKTPSSLKMCSTKKSMPW